MPKPIAVTIRQQIVERHQQGQSLGQIATDLRMPYSSVRNVWSVYRRTGRIAPDYQACGRRGSRASKRIQRAAVWLKRAHPKWGAPLIRVLLQQKWPQERLPHERSLQRWFRASGVGQRSTGRQPRHSLERGAQPHDVWEMDSKEGLILAGNEAASWVIMSDEASGSMLAGTVFPHPLGQSNQPPTGSSQPAGEFYDLGFATCAARGQRSALGNG